MNGGHSAVAVLAARPKVRVIAFDLGEFAFSGPVEELLHTVYGQRFRMVCIVVNFASVRWCVCVFSCKVTFPGAYYLHIWFRRVRRCEETLQSPSRSSLPAGRAA